MAEPRALRRPFLWPALPVRWPGPAREPRTLQSLVTAGLVLGALLLVTVAVLLIGSTTALRQSLRRGTAARESTEALLRTETDLLRYVVLSAALLGSGDADLEDARSASRTRIERNVERALARAADPSERRQLERLRTDLASYFAARDGLEVEDAPAGEISAVTRPHLAASLEGIQRLERERGAALSRTRARTERLSALSGAAGTAAIILLLVGFAAAAYGLVRRVLHPLRTITEAVDRVRLGETLTRAPERGPAELVRLARTLNQTSVALTEQRTLALAFLAGAAHDLRNPLSALKMSIELLRQTEPDLTSRPSAARTFALLERQIDRLARLVNDLVDAARIEAGELELTMEEHDLRVSAREMVQLYAPTTERHRIELTVPDTPVTVRADPLRIEQVASNLISNAIKYSPDGGTIRVDARVEGSCAVLSVSDEGVGIAPEQLETVFEPFRRTPAAIGVATGAGLGLSVIRRIVHGHDGRVEVESTPGVGSTFRVLLPRAVSDAPPAPDAR